MKNVFRAARQSLQQRLIEDCSFDRFDVVEASQVVSRSAAQVIEHGDSCAQRGQCAGEMRTNESRAAGHQRASIFERVAMQFSPVGEIRIAHELIPTRPGAQLCSNRSRYDFAILCSVKSFSRMVDCCAKNASCWGE